MLLIAEQSSSNAAGRRAVQVYLAHPSRGRARGALDLTYARRTLTQQARATYRGAAPFSTCTPNAPLPHDVPRAHRGGGKLRGSGEPLTAQEEVVVS